jgi:hypothetical protein
MAVTARRRVEGIFVLGSGVIGPQDGVNRTYTTPDKFRSLMGFYRNGVKLYLGSGFDFEIGESGGPGTGYDTLTLVSAARPPLPNENLQVDFIRL